MVVIPMVVTPMIGTKRQSSEVVTMSNTTHEIDTSKVNENNQPQSEGKGRKVSFLQTMGSVIAASFGVQSRKNKVRDFQNGSFAGFVVGALLFTAVFVATLLIIVNLVLN